MGMGCDWQPEIVIVIVATINKNVGSFIEPSLYKLCTSGLRYRLGRKKLRNGKLPKLRTISQKTRPVPPSRPALFAPAGFAGVHVAKHPVRAMLGGVLSENASLII
jgi:hypothetical protein